MVKRTASTLAAAVPGGSVDAMSRGRGAVMTRRRFVVGAAAVAVAPALAGCNSLERAAGTGVDAPWRMSSSMPGDPGNAHSECLAAFKDAVGGALRVDYYPDSQLGDEAKSVPQVRIGAVDLMISGSSIWSTVVPEFGLLDMGYLFDNWDDVAAALDGDVGAALARRLHAKTGLEIIGWPFNFGVRNVLTTRAVARPDDLKGLKVRTLPAPEVVETLNLMGAVATPISIGEVYTSLQTGLIDGLEHDAPTIENNKYDEVAKDLALTRHLFNPLAVLANGDSLAALPAGRREAVRDAARRATEEQRAAVEPAERKALRTLEKRGVTVRSVNRRAFRDAVRPLWAKFAAEHPSARPILAEILPRGG